MTNKKCKFIQYPWI